MKSINPTKQLHAPTIASNGNIYEDGIEKYEYSGGHYLNGEKIGILKGMYPYVSPDESYIIYAARNPAKYDFDLYISFSDQDGNWSEGISLGKEINSQYNEGNSFVTADTKYLFFSRKLDIYWVDAKIIEELKHH